MAVPAAPAPARKPHGVDDGGSCDHCCSVLVIVENRYVTALSQFSFDLKAAWRRNVLKVDPSEAACKEPYGIDDLIHILAPDTQRKGVHPCESLEEHTFAFHYRHGCLRPYVPQAKNGAAVGHYSYHVGPPGIYIGKILVPGDLKAWLGHSRSVGYGQFLPVFNRGPALYLYLALPFAVHIEGNFSRVHWYHLI